jgi:pimeloyl-ACP methyl ester carboxylesterase
MERPMKTLVTFSALVLTVGIATAQQVDIGRAPGRLIDIGGRMLHLNCAGTGSPAVILEAGASSFALDWSLVQPEVARGQRVCSYDRAGSGWSDPRGNVETPARIAADLHALLTTAREKPPFVMVGASAGGLYVRLYQLEHPTEVLGLVLVDPATEDRLFTMFQGRPVPISSLTAEQLLTTLPSSGSVPIPSSDPQTGPPFDRLSSDLYQLRIKLDQRLVASFPSSVSADVVRESSEGQRAALARLFASRSQADNPMRDVPVIVLTRGQDMTPGIAENHAALARLSTNSRQTVISGSGHEVHLFSPDAVVQAIQDVSRAATQRSKLPVRD